MHFNGLTLAAAVLSILAWIATPALAGHNPLGQGHGHGHGAGFSAGGGHQQGAGGSGHHKGVSDSPHSNKGGALRGLNRANQVAGPHGEEGRENAAAHQPGGSSSDGDSDSE
jgi:hypothetical protein